MIQIDYNVRVNEMELIITRHHQLFKGLEFYDFYNFKHPKSTSDSASPFPLSASIVDHSINIIVNITAEILFDNEMTKRSYSIIPCATLSLADKCLQAELIVPDIDSQSSCHHALCDEEPVIYALFT
jgi:hypothetical protein